MGFYSNQNLDPHYEQRPSPKRNYKMAKLLGVVILSAAVGSAVTLAAVVEVVNPNLTAMSIGSGTIGSSTPASTGVSTNVNVNVNDSITQVVKNVRQGVVGVVNYQQSRNPFSQSSTSQPYGVGTGVLFYKDSNYGYFVSNNHVVEGADKLEVVLDSGQHVSATLVGADPYTDLAVLKIPVKSIQHVQPLQFANSDNLQAGEPAIAIGTPMGLDFAESVTTGIISSPKRVMPVEDPNTQETLDYQAVIQTDAAINPGNSGGPLLNINGQVVGINSSKLVEQNVEGMGFAIPANEVQNIASEIMKTGKVLHPALGIEGVSMDSAYSTYLPNVPVDYGVVVQNVTSQEAQQAGIQRGDVIVNVDGKSIQTIADLRTELFNKHPGQTVTLKFYRGDKLETVQVVLASLDPNNLASNQGQGSNNP